MKRGFSLVELLVVVGIIAILAALLFPVFRAARISSQQSICSGQFRQVLAAHLMYSSEYDDRFVQASYRSDANATPLNDRKWPQILGAYTRTNSVYECPSDRAERPSLESVFSADLSLADPDARLYVRAQRSNLGYNAHYLSPRIGTGPNAFYSPVATSMLEDPAATLQLVDSVWSVRNGRPSGGGNYIIQPPCRFVAESGILRNTIEDSAIDDFPLDRGWSVSQVPDQTTYGGAWPWHGGRLTVGYADGHVRARVPKSLGEGCDVKPALKGTILSLDVYQWDLR